ncbi:MAG: helix-turn-helix transcriptional regulator [Rhodospirillales bacterium]|nr:helix-turn-helix transcriptional regulator [Rhodospirillales bacterium]
MVDPQEIATVWDGESGTALVAVAAGRLDSHEDGEDLKAAVGQEVKFWRNQRGLTGSRLARMSGVSAGMLTKIEKGDVAPSLQTLVKISEALDVPASMFLHRLQKRPYVSFVPAGKGLKTDRRGTRGNQIFELVGHNLGHTIGIEPFIITVDEKSEPYPMLQEEGYKFMHMMEGEVIFRHGKRKFPLKPGDSLTYDAMAPHGAERFITVPARWLSIGVYPRFEQGSRSGGSAEP